MMRILFSKNKNEIQNEKKQIKRNQSFNIGCRYNALFIYESMGILLITSLFLFFFCISISQVKEENTQLPPTSPPPSAATPPPRSNCKSIFICIFITCIVLYICVVIVLLYLHRGHIIKYDTTIEKVCDIQHEKVYI